MTLELDRSVSGKVLRLAGLSFMKIYVKSQTKVSVLFRRGQAGWLRRGARKVLCFNLLAVLLASQGCTSIAKKVEDEQVAEIEIGKSTRDDVLNILGLPNKTERMVFEGDKLEFWIYHKGRDKRSFKYKEGKRTFHLVGTSSADVAVSAIFYLVSAPKFKVEEINKMATIVAFDERGTVVDVKEEDDITRF